MLEKKIADSNVIEDKTKGNKVMEDKAIGNKVIGNKAIQLIIIFSFLLLIFIAALIRCRSHTLTEYMQRLENSGRIKKDIIIAVIDSGCNNLYEYQDRILAGYDFVQEDSIPDDTFGHGTQIADLILSNTPGCIRIMPLKAADENGYAQVWDVCRALEYAADKGADIVNLSLNAVINGSDENENLNSLITRLAERGIQVIVSAGNTGGNVCSLFPASAEEAIVVAAVDDNKFPYFFSGYGENVKFCSLGKYNGEIGTSYSAAYVTSVAAMLKMYGVEKIDEVLNQYAEKYCHADVDETQFMEELHSREHMNSAEGMSAMKEPYSVERSYGKGIIWLDWFSAGNENTKGNREPDDLAAFSAKEENDLGMEILHMNWKEMSAEELETYLFETAKEYVGMFFKSLSPDEIRLLEEKCPSIHSKVSVDDCHWDSESESFTVVSNTILDFMDYCIRQYESNLNRMTISGWFTRNNTIVFYIANEDRSIKYRYEVRGNIYGKAATTEDNNLLGADDTLTVIAFGEDHPLFRKPRLAPSGIKNYVTDITSRWVAYSGPDVEAGRVRAKDYNPIYNTINKTDNGTIHYGLSFAFTGMTLNPGKGYHYASDEVKGYLYNTSQPAVSYRYTTLLPTGWIIEETPTHTVPIDTGFQKISDRIEAVSYNAKEEYSYQACPDPTAVSLDEAAEYYHIKSFQAYLPMQQSSFDVEKGNMTLNSHIYQLSSMAFYESSQNKLVISNDIVEYVIAQAPNEYDVILNANGGTIAKSGTLEQVSSTAITTCYDSTRHQNISGAIPVRDNYIFTGWYTDINGGEQIWNADGIAQEGSYWENGIWKYSENWTEDNHTLNVYAHWEPAWYDIYFDANGGTGTRQAMTNLEYNKTYILPAHHWPENGYIKSGFYFSGWNTEADGSGIHYIDMSPFRKMNDGTDNTVVLYAQWMLSDVVPPEITPDLQEDNPAEMNLNHYIYGWTNRAIPLRFSAADNMAMDSLVLYEGEGTTGSILDSSTDHVEYIVSEEGICHYTLAAKDKTGNISTAYITTKIDYVTPTGSMDVSYDGYCLNVTLHHIVEEHPQDSAQKASGCQKAWILLQGLNAEGNVICQEEKELLLMTENIYTGAVYQGDFGLGDDFNYVSDYIHITAYIMDYAGNYLPSIASATIPAFVLNADLERTLGQSEHWKAGEAGIVHIYTAAWTDQVKIAYPADWIALDETLNGRCFDYAAEGKAFEKTEDELFYIPIKAENGSYTITVYAYKNGREKSVTLSLDSCGCILDELRTRLR